MAKSYLDKDGLLYFLQKIRPSQTPSMDGTASTGTSKRFAAEDHVHPTDTSLAPKASPAFTGTPTAPTAATGTTTTQLATTEFVANAVAASTSGVSDVRIDGTSVVSSGVANISTMTSATSSAAGTKGIVPAPPQLNVASTFLMLTGTHGWQAMSLRTEILSSGPDIGKRRIVLAAVNQDDSTVNRSTYAVIPDATTSTTGFMSATDKTKLDSITMTNGKIDASVLPSYVDDVIEAYPRSGQTELSQNWLSETSGGSALTPETGKIYILMADSTSYATNTQFRWSGTAYVKMLDGGVTSITNAEIDTIVAA